MPWPSSLARVGCLAAAGLWIGGCQSYRIEHYERPQFYYEASDGELVDEWTAPDGTVVKFNSPSLEATEALEKQAEGSRRSVDRDGDGKPDEVEPTPIWEERDDGTILMRAFLPQHVLSNFMEALRMERYDDFYDQLLARTARETLDSQFKGQGRKAFAKWCRKNRSKLMEMLNRMNFEYMSSDVVLRKVGGDGYRIGFTPRLATQFKYDTVDVVYEKGAAKLVGVR